MSDGIACQQCGHINEAWRTRCEKCRAGFPAAQIARYRAVRPRLVTIYLCLNVVMNCLLLFQLAYDAYAPFWLVLPVGQLIGVAGVWRMKKRGRLIFLFFSALMILLLVAGIFSNLAPVSIWAVLRVLMDVVFFIWLLTNGYLFED